MCASFALLKDKNVFSLQGASRPPDPSPGIRRLHPTRTTPGPLGTSPPHFYDEVYAYGLVVIFKN